MTDNLEFTSLPLLEVLVRLLPEQFIGTDLRVLSDLYEAFKRLGFTEIQTLDQPIPAVGQTQFMLPMGQPLGARYIDPGTGLTIAMQPNSIQLGWDKARCLKYPRFEAIATLAANVLDALAHTHGKRFLIKGANMTYTNFIRSSAHPTWNLVREYLKPEVTASRFSGTVKFNEQTLAWRDDNGADMRLQVTTTLQGASYGVAIVTVAGRLFEPTDDPRAFLDDNHRLLRDFFISILTKSALAEWGYES